jgi:radical SAM superfamily enzyme YgiQ (UPF0313 family)
MPSDSNNSVPPVEPLTKPGTGILLTRAHYRKAYRSPGFPVGVALIASYLESRGIPVQVLDLAVQENWKEALKARLEKDAFAFVGISLQITQFEEASQVAGFIKRNFPQTKIVFGGSFPSSAPEDCLANPDIDVVCCSEGELTLYHLIQAWEQGNRPDAAPGPDRKSRPNADRRLSPPGP